MNDSIWSMFMNDCTWAAFHLGEDGEEFTRIVTVRTGLEHLKKTMSWNSVEFHHCKNGTQNPGRMCLCWISQSDCC